jgi:DNA-binding MarR family transcriptional regulator
MATVPELALLMALRVRGRADAAQLARAVGCGVDDARAALAAAAERGLVAPVGSATETHAVTLTDAGRAALATLLAEEALDRAALATLYERFLAADRELKSAITAWQLAPEGQKVAARAPVMAIAASAGGVARALAEALPRLAPYAHRIADAAAAITTGDPQFVASPRVDSLHQVWFELHEDLLATLGRSRAT